MSASQPVIVVGFSVRALVQSLRWAGFEAVGVDLCGDQDLAAIARTRRVDLDDFPDRLPSIVGELPAGPWLYGGPLENQPELVDEIAGARRFVGIGGEALRAVRDPERLHDTLTREGLPALEVRTSALGLPHDFTWLRKPRNSAAGIGVGLLDDPAEEGANGCYFQRRVQGMDASALFCGYGLDEAGVRFLGASRQWIGRGPGRPFGWVGNIGPWPLGERVEAELKRMGQVLGREFGLRGLFGIDLVIAEETAWPVEVNPRPTAAVEVLERATGQSLMHAHMRAFGVGTEVQPGQRVPQRVAGKAVLFAATSGRISLPARAVDRCLARVRGGRWTSIADVGWPEVRYGEGDPVATVFARGRSVEECEKRLRRVHDLWRQRLARAGFDVEPLGCV